MQKGQGIKARLSFRNNVLTLVDNATGRPFTREGQHITGVHALNFLFTEMYQQAMSALTNPVNIASYEEAVQVIMKRIKGLYQGAERELSQRYPAVLAPDDDSVEEPP